jgi:hypothetical protein
MLKRQILIYDDGRKEDNIIFVDDSSPTTIYPQRDGIKHSFLTTFKYKVRLKGDEIIAIVRFADKTTIFPSNIEVHPKTTLSDIEIIRSKKRIEKPQENIYKIESTTSGSMYMVREIAGRYTCNCTGFFRVKDKTKGCKHIQDIKSRKV